jgi:tyrosyl-tRNA synthetase
MASFGVAPCSDDLAFRGLIHQVTDEEVPGLLDRGGLTVYTGFDPTATSLHVGSLLQLCTLRRLQLAGHRPIALLGGATGMIGDPGGKTDERALLSPEELDERVRGVLPQLSRFLDVSAAAGATQALVLDNRDWLGPLLTIDFLRDVGKHFTVNQMVAKESVRARLERPDQGISYTEFSYMLLQAYDFLRLFQDRGCTLQLGGSDQWGNITMGVELIRKVAGGRAFGLTSPLVLKADGTKFGKTESGTVWLDAELTSPYALYQFFLQVEDAVVGAYLRYFTFLSHEEIEALDVSVRQRPQAREAQRALARAVCDLVHGEAERTKAEAAGAALFGGDLGALEETTLRQVLAEAPSSTVGRSLLETGWPVVDALVQCGLCASKGEARRALSQGGVYLNNSRVEDPDRAIGSDDLLHGRFLVLRRGKRDLHLVTVT